MSDNLVNFLIPLPVLIPLFSAGLALSFGRHKKIQAFITFFALFLVMLVAIILIFDTYNTGTHALHIGGWGPLGGFIGPLGITLVVDQLAAIMILVSSITLLIVVMFSIGQGINQESEDGPISIFLPSYLILTVGISNAFLTGDLFNLYVSFEILLAASFVLLTIGVSEDRVRAGISYVIISIVSSLIFLCGIVFAYAATGTLNLAIMGETIDQLPAGTKNALFAVLLVAFGIKAAIFPLSSWLPDSYPSAPSPVTAVFAGLLTKVGVYSIIRTNTILFRGDSFNNALMIAGFFTMIFGILGAIAQTEIKRLLSFTLVSHIGYMIFGIGLANVLSLGGAIYYMAHHIFVQTSLFLVVGIIEYMTGTSSIKRLRGLSKASPLIAALFLIPALNLAGIPPFSGFIGKLSLLEAGINTNSFLAWLLVIGSIATSFLTLFAITRVWSGSFWRPVDTESMGNVTIEKSKAIPRAMTIPTLLLVVVSLSMSIFAGPLISLSQHAARDLTARTQYINEVLNSQNKQEQKG